METMGQRIRHARQRRVLTQEELAHAAGVALITVNRLENDAIENPRPATVRKLAGALEVGPAWLLFGDDEGKIAA
jgi:transcriptional regulator with XRE-family HTH domain